MLYPGLPLLSGEVTPNNTELSTTDREYIARIYPLPPAPSSFSVSFSDPLSKIPSGESRTITVKVRSAEGNPIEGIKVRFRENKELPVLYEPEIEFSPSHPLTNKSGVAESTMLTGSWGEAKFYISVAGLPGEKEYTASVARVLKTHTEKRWFSSRHAGEDCRRVFGVKICNPDLTPDWYTASEYIDVPASIPMHDYSITTHVPLEDQLTKPYVKDDWRSGHRVHLRIRFREHIVESNDILVRVHAKYWGTEPAPGTAAPLKPEARPDPEPVAAIWQDVTYIPAHTALLANYPNPFNPETWIPYNLSVSANVSISIYAVDGRWVRTLDLGHQPAGVYQNKSRAAYWDGRNNVGERVASGIYFYTLTAGDFAATRKMLIMK